MKKSITRMCFLILFILLFFIFLFINCIISYSAYDLDYSDLRCEELTFIKYEKVHRASDEVYFKEYEQPFKLNSIADKKLDKATLAQIAENESVTVFYRDISFKHFEHEICEISHGNLVLLRLSDYTQTNQSNQFAGMILCPIIIIICLFLLWGFLGAAKAIHTGDMEKTE